MTSARSLLALSSASVVVVGTETLLIALVSIETEVLSRSRLTSGCCCEEVVSLMVDRKDEWSESERVRERERERERASEVVATSNRRVVGWLVGGDVQSVQAHKAHTHTIN